MFILTQTLRFSGLISLHIRKCANYLLIPSQTLLVLLDSQPFLNNFHFYMKSKFVVSFQPQNETMWNIFILSEFMVMAYVLSSLNWNGKLVEHMNIVIFSSSPILSIKIELSHQSDMLHYLEFDLLSKIGVRG